MRKTGNYKHGLHATRIYGIWKAINWRCSKPSYARYFDYGGRGITVCAGFKKLSHFMNIMGEPPDGKQVERMENDLGYWCGVCEECLANGWPLNCCWATRTENGRNKRNNVFVYVDGVRMTVSEAAEVTGVNRHTIYARLDAGCSPYEAVYQPRKYQKRKPGSTP